MPTELQIASVSRAKAGAGSVVSLANSVPETALVAGLDCGFLNKRISNP